MLEFARPYTPDLVGWFRDFGQGAANYDANGHFARIQPIFNAFQFTDNPAGGLLTPIPPSARMTGLQTGNERRCPGAATQRPGRRVRAVHRRRHRRLQPLPGAARTMTRLVVLLALMIVLAGFAVFVVTAGDDDGGGYKVRAIFENAGFVIPGEDVKVAGVKIGKIDSLDVTEDNKAAVVLKITDPGYQDFRNDAECTVRPQSLIGERFVECELTQARPAGTEPPPKLDQIKDGPGKGQYLLPVENTSKSVDLDLINNIMREPVRQRLSIILDDLGIGVAGRGEDLKVVIRRADPALKEVDKVLKILASQNDTLQRLAVDSDTILAPLARERRHVSGAIENSSAVARATAERARGARRRHRAPADVPGPAHADDGAASARSPTR